MFLKICFSCLEDHLLCLVDPELGILYYLAILWFCDFIIII